MPTAGKTKQILVHEDLAEYLLEVRDTKGIVVHKQIDLALSEDFLKHYNRWAKDHGKRQITPETKADWTK